MFTKFRLGTAILFATVALAAFAGLACGDDDEDEDGGVTTPAPAAISPTSGVEIDISGVEELEDGTLTIGSDIAYPPVEFLDDSNNAVGLDVDLANRIGEALGVEVDFQNGGFDTLLPALDTERYDAIMSAMTATDERKQNYDFVEYFNAGAGIVVPAGNPKGITSADDLCGMTVATQEGTTHVDFLEGVEGTPGLDQKCKDAGKEGVQVLKFGTDPEAVAALTAGQADANMADFPVAAYSAQQSDGALEIIPEQIDPAPYGIAVRKTSTALRDALQAALDLIQADGTYAAILTEWNLEDGALD